MLGHCVEGGDFVAVRPNISNTLFLQVECGVELGIIYGDTLRSSAIPVSEVSVKAAAEIIEAFPPSTESQQIRVLNRFVRWSRELFGGSRGHPVFHDFCCKCCVELKDAKRAQLHGVSWQKCRLRSIFGFLMVCEGTRQ